MTTPNMSLTLPTVGATTGPQWANEINGDLETIDSHDHTPNNGVQIPVAGININDDLTFNAKSAVDVATVGFSGLGSQLSQTLIQRLYVYSGDLYYNDGNGTQIPITLNGNVNAGTTGNISGLTAPASASYAGGVFAWRQDVNFPARMDCGSVVVRPEVSSQFGIRLVCPLGIALADQLLTLPKTPAAQSLVTMSPSGVQTTATVNSTLTLTSSSLTVAVNGISTAYLADDAVSTAKVQDYAITRNKLAPLLNNQSFPSGTTNAITSTSFVQVPSNNVLVPLEFSLSGVVASRPVVIQLQTQIDSPTGVGTTFGYILSPAGGVQLYVRITSASPSVDVKASFVALSGSTQSTPSAISSIYIPPGNGTYMFTLYAKVNTPGSSAYVYNCRLVGYQL